MRNFILITLVIFYLHLSNPLFAQYDNILFHRIDIKKGLSSNTVSKICQDAQGFMWFGTDRGLNRFDGYKFRTYRSNPEDPGSLSHEQISSILRDINNNLWVGMQNSKSINRYDLESDNFIKDNVPAPFLNHDKKGNIWMGNPEITTGISVLNIRNSTITRYDYDPADPNSISSNSITSIFTDDSGIIWIGAGGLNKYNQNDRSFTHFLKGRLGLKVSGSGI